MHPLHQKWLLDYMNFSKNHQPIEGIGNAMVCVCNIKCAIPIWGVFEKPKFGSNFVIFLTIFVIAFLEYLLTCNDLMKTINLNMLDETISKS